jgi:hypothetical protein
MTHNRIVRTALTEGIVVGFRDIEAAQGEGLPWIVDNSFVTDANALVGRHAKNPDGRLRGRNNITGSKQGSDC